MAACSHPAAFSGNGFAEKLFLFYGIVMKFQPECAKIKVRYVIFNDKENHFMLANYHTHTVRCRHAEGGDREYIEAAIKGGMKVLGFSDHCPWIYEDGFVSGTRMLPSQLDDYFTSLERLRQEYKDDITIYIGFEAEYIPEQVEAQYRLLDQYPVDYMILGQHFTSREPYSAYTGFAWDSESELKKYVDTVIEGMETGRYSYVAHPDLFHYTGDEAIYRRHYGRLCSYLKEKNVPVEINMLGHFQHRHYPSALFLKIAQETGNSAVIGCDAHSPYSLLDTAEQQACRQLAAEYDLPLVDYLPGLGEKTQK